MTIKEIEAEICDTSYHFLAYHDFSGCYDRYRENHNIVTNGIYNIVAKNNKRDKWKVGAFNESNKFVSLTDYMSLAECLNYCGAHGNPNSY